jgi:hypothetical protein
VTTLPLELSHDFVLDRLIRKIASGSTIMPLQSSCCDEFLTACFTCGSFDKDRTLPANAESRLAALYAP